MRTLNYGLGVACIVVSIALLFQILERPTAREQLNGTWTSDLLTYHVNVADSTYERVVFGAVERKAFVITRETWASVTLVADGPPLIATFHMNGTMTMSQEGRIPVTLRRP